MLIAISGAQSAGKSTLLKELKKDKRFTIDDFKVSRQIQKHLGYNTLEEALTSNEKIAHFQQMILQHKYDHDIGLINKDKITFVERSFADIYAYTKEWSKRFTIDPTLWLRGQYLYCKEHQEIYDAVILIPFMADQINFEEDPNRANRESVDIIYQTITEFCDNSSVKKYEITTGPIQERILEVTTFLETL
jgi:nicotinamide riboside kinase